MVKKFKATERINTGVAEVVGFCALYTPSVKFNPDGVYNCNVLISKEEAEKIIKVAEDVRAKQYKVDKGAVQEFTKVKPYVKVIKNEETGVVISETPDPQGRYLLKTDLKAYIKDGRPSQRPVLVDAKNNIISKDLEISEGSLVRLTVDLEGYAVGGKTGVSARVKLVQVIKPVKYQGNIQSTFDAVEDGYVYSDEEDDNTVAGDENDTEEATDF